MNVLRTAWILLLLFPAGCMPDLAVAEKGLAENGVAQNDVTEIGAGADASAAEKTAQAPATAPQTAPVEKSAKQWRQQLTKAQFDVLREKGTEAPFTGEYWDHKAHGVYTCAGCGRPLFLSDTKFRSGTGWPSFWMPVSDTAIDEETDSSLWRSRTEVLCSRCGGHLGHVFKDGPKPTGLRYCINSAALGFESRPIDEPTGEAAAPLSQP